MQSLSELFKHKKHILFDWNGTLLDDVELCVEIINGLLEKHQLNTISRDQYRKIFRFPVLEYYAALGFDFEKQSFADLSDVWMGEYNERVGECRLFDGAVELISGLRESGKDLSILSAAFEADIHELLSSYKIDHYFNEVFGLDNIHAAGKTQRAKDLISKLGAPVEEVVLIGDTWHDYEVAKDVGIDVVILADGHQCETVFETAECPVYATRYQNQITIS